MRNRITYLGWTFEDTQIESGTLALEESLDIRTLGTDTFEVAVKCADASITGFAQNTPVTYFRNSSQLGVFYVQSITRAGVDLYTISAISSVGRLAQRQHYGGIYTGQTAAAIVADICGDIPYFLQSRFANLKLYGWLPIATARDNLAQVLFALNANLRTDNEGTLRIENLSATATAEFGSDSIYRDGAIVDYDTPVTSVTVLEHQYVAGGDETTLFEGTTVAGQRITFSQPMSNLAATGFSILSSGANYAVVSSGSGTLTGRAYVHTTREITRSVTSAQVPNEIRIEDATLVSLTNSSPVVERLVDYYAHRETIRADAVIAFEAPGDVVGIFHPFDRKMVEACIATSSINLSATLKSSLTALVGFTPHQTVEMEDVRELLTGSGTWTVPGGVTEVTAVLIGGGSGGSGGKAGFSGTARSINQSFRTGTISVSHGPGGAGGTGGAGGAAGRIYRVEIAVSAGDKISYSCGAAGSGSTSTGSPGGNSTFGSHSSASGASSGGGYYDVTTGKTFAIPGSAGPNGGAGGSGGAMNSGAASNGGAGGSTGGYSGGIGGKGVFRQGTLTGKAWTESAAGGGGGGAAYGRTGDAGTAGRNTSGTTVTGGGGGNGASAVRPSDQTNYGNGGTGGGGGGGGGGTGSWYYYQQADEGSYTIKYSPSAGSAGSGASGGDGAPGCIILYYRRPKAA